MGGRAKLGHDSGEENGLYYDDEGNLHTSLSDCVTVKEARVGLCYAWKGDNHGPHSYDEASGILKAVRGLYPNADVVASDAFDDFVAAAWEHRATLPVVTAEIGDTWIYGASTDPLRVARFRAASRLAAA